MSLFPTPIMIKLRFRSLCYCLFLSDFVNVIVVPQSTSIFVKLFIGRPFKSSCERLVLPSKVVCCLRLHVTDLQRTIWPKNVFVLSCEC